MAYDVSDLDEPPSGTRKLQARRGLLAHVVPRRYLSDCGQRANRKVVLTERYYIQLYLWCQLTIYLMMMLSSLNCSSLEEYLYIPRRIETFETYIQCEKR